MFFLRGFCSCFSGGFLFLYHFIRLSAFLLYFHLLLLFRLLFLYGLGLFLGSILSMFFRTVLCFCFSIVLCFCFSIVLCYCFSIALCFSFSTILRHRFSIILTRFLIGILSGSLCSVFLLSIRTPSSTIMMSLPFPLLRRATFCYSAGILLHSSIFSGIGRLFLFRFFRLSRPGFGNAVFRCFLYIHTLHPF